jgi:hypothetical protein
METWDYQAGAEIGEPDLATYCVNCMEYITAFLPAFIATGLGESVAR